MVEVHEYCILTISAVADKRILSFDNLYFIDVEQTKLGKYQYQNALMPTMCRLVIREICEISTIVE